MTTQASNRLSVIDKSGREVVLFEPYDYQIPWLETEVPNFLSYGTRNTGKSKWLRFDAILRCLMFPYFQAVILRRTMPQLYKALALDTPIPTPCGWKTMGSIQVGEFVFAPDGTQTKVTGKSPVHVDPKGTFAVTFDRDGETLIASGSHEWSVQTKMGSRWVESPRTITTLQLARSLHRSADQRSRYAIPISSEWRTESSDLLVGPYTLGAWLGDGTKNQGAITTTDPEVISEIERDGYLVRKRPKHKHEWGILGLKAELKALGVLVYKHIPDSYFCASSCQRLRLLQGLMDTDGGCQESSGMCQFTQTNERRVVAEGVFRLAASLGLKPKWREYPASLNGKPCGTAYAVQWSSTLPVFRISRKLGRLRSSYSPVGGYHYISKVEMVSDVPCQCLTVDHPSHQYVVGNGSIATHNSHLTSDLIPREMELLGGDFISNKNIARFPNGSTITFSHCEKEKDALDYLGSSFGFVGFDELSTFTLPMFLNISSAARAPKDSPYRAVVRCGSNPLGIGARWMRDWFITKTVDFSEYEDYNPDEYAAMFSELSQNVSANKKEYEGRLKNLPKHIRKAWLKGEFIDEGSYFEDFQPQREISEDKKVPWHVIQEMPTVMGMHALDIPWLNIYRSFDWGYYPDPAVCLWTAILPNGQEIVFKEKYWNQVLAADVAKDIRIESEGMRILETFADPSCFSKRGETTFSVGEIIQQNGVPLTMSTNDRALYGYAIHDHLNTIIEGKPKLQILDKMGSLGCPELIKTLPEMQVDPSDANKIREGNDHFVVTLAYMCIGSPVASKDPRVNTVPRWMRRGRRRG